MRWVLIVSLFSYNILVAQVKVTPQLFLGWTIGIRGVQKNYQLGIGADYNRTFSTNLILGLADNSYYFHPPDYGFPHTIRYFDLHLGVQYRILPKKAFSPVLDFAIGRGFKSKTSTGVVYFDGNGSITSKDGDFPVGSFQFVQSSFDLQMLCDYSHKNWSFQLGAGVASTIFNLKGEEYVIDGDILYSYRGLKVSVKCLYRITRKKSKNE